MGEDEGMKPINKQARKIMNKLIEELDNGANVEDNHKEIDNSKGAFMPIHIEAVRACNLGPIYSIAHYYEQNGDMMRDPDMEFIKGADGEYYPVSFWQDAPLKRDEAVSWAEGEITGIRPKLQAELAAFANMWMKNIKEQQGLVV